MQVPYKILVVIRPIKIKQKKNSELCVWCLLNDCAHWLCVTSLCPTANTQITNFPFQVLVRHYFFVIFFGFYLHFFPEQMERLFFGGAPEQDHTSRFFPALAWTTLLDAFLKKRMAPSTWKSEGSEKCRVEIYNWVVRN